MTPDEHKLMILVFARQLQMGKTFIEILKSRGVLEQGDSEAFASIVYRDASSNTDLALDAAKQYLHFAKMLGVDTGIEN